MKNEEKSNNLEKTENNELLLEKSKTSGLKIDLDLIEKQEGNFANNNLDEEYLRFDCYYRPISKDCQIKSKEQNNENQFRKSSTISTTISMNENGNGYETNKKYNENSDICSSIFFSKNKFYSNLICNYYDGTDNYLRRLNPEKNDYQKSNNYLKKEKYFRGHFASFDFINQYNEEKFEGDKIPMKLSADINFTSPNPLNSSLVSNDNVQNTSYKNVNQNNNLPFYYFSYYNGDGKFNL